MTSAGCDGHLELKSKCRVCFVPTCWRPMHCVWMWLLQVGRNQKKALSSFIPPTHHPIFGLRQLLQCDRLTRCTQTTKQHFELQSAPTCDCWTNVIKSEPDSWGKHTARLLLNNETHLKAALMGKCANRATLSKREVFCIACQTHWRWQAYCITPGVNISRALLQCVGEM